MGSNSHRPDINEAQKKWSIVVTEMGYDFATMTKKEFLAKYELTAEEYERVLAGLD